MNTSTITTILGAAALGMLKSSGSRNKGITVNSIDQLIECAYNPKKVSSVQTVDLRSKNLDYFPKEIVYFKNLKRLALSRNSLTSIPSEIGKLKNLEILLLGNNKLTALPKEIGNLKKVRRFSLGNVKYTPRGIGARVNLDHLREMLSLNRNSFTSLPPEIGNMTSITQLDVKNLNLNSLPKEIADLVNLNLIMLDGNDLKTPDTSTLRYWMKNLKKDTLKEILQNTKSPSSQLRRF